MAPSRICTAWAVTKLRRTSAYDSLPHWASPPSPVKDRLSSLNRARRFESSATVPTRAGINPHSVKADVPDGTLTTADVRVRTTSTNSRARSSSSARVRAPPRREAGSSVDEGEGGGRSAASTKARPRDMPRASSSSSSSSPPSPAPSASSMGASVAPPPPPEEEPCSPLPRPRRKAFRLASEYLTRAGSSPRNCPFPTPSSARVALCFSAGYMLEPVPAGSLRATSAVRASTARVRTEYGTGGGGSDTAEIPSRPAERDESRRPDSPLSSRPSGWAAAPPPMPVPLDTAALDTVGLNKSHSSLHSSGWAAKYPPTTSWFGWLCNTATRARRRFSMATIRSVRRWNDRARRTSARRGNRRERGTEDRPPARSRARKNRSDVERISIAAVVLEESRPGRGMGAAEEEGRGVTRRGD
mmetsp:Transcript_33464/g.99700  ORF Transcript_33464/g.99700 Transcript_33464/m.99700 type:complete len:415 (+) Transcript_33464:3525-4769(+)